MKQELSQIINSQGCLQRWVEVKSDKHRRSLRDRATIYVLGRHLTRREHLEIIKARRFPDDRSIVQLDNGEVYYHDHCENGTQFDAFLGGRRGFTATMIEFPEKDVVEMRYFGDEPPAGK